MSIVGAGNDATLTSHQIPRKSEAGCFQSYEGFVLNHLVPFYIIDARASNRFLLLIRKGKATCSAPWYRSINSCVSPVNSS